MKTFKKAQIIAKNTPAGSYAAGCPANDNGSGVLDYLCRDCERTV